MGWEIKGKKIYQYVAGQKTSKKIRGASQGHI